MFITDNRAVDFNGLSILALDRNKSRSYVLPFNVSPGRYSMAVYDIEHNGTLLSGVVFPAFIDELFLHENSQGKISVCACNNHHHHVSSC